MFFLKVNSYLKGLLLYLRIGLLLKPLKHLFKFLHNFIGLSVWIKEHHSKAEFTDFYTSKKDHGKRQELHKFVSDKYNLANTPIQYYEFGVAAAHSFKWWLNECQNEQSIFYGFDTFEGLPESWHVYSKGDMSADIPEIDDKRANFIKGLFQDTFFKFLKSNPPTEGVRKVIHLDADLYSSTLFILTSFAPYLKSGDIIFFDEFNVPNHEYAAWEQFTKSFYVDYDVIGGVNNYYQMACIIKNYNED